MTALPDCPHMPRKCAHYDLSQCHDPASRMCHYVQNTISTAVAVRSVLAPMQEMGLLRDRRATARYLDEIEALLRAAGLEGE